MMFKPVIALLKLLFTNPLKFKVSCVLPVLKLIAPEVTEPLYSVTELLEPPDVELTKLMALFVPEMVPLL